MQRLRYVLAVLGLAAALAMGFYAHRVENPILACAAILIAAVATGFAAGNYAKHVVTPNLKRAETIPAIRGGPLYWLLRLAMLAVALGITGLLFVSQHQVELPDRDFYLALAGGAVAAGVGLMIGVIAVFKLANRPRRDGGAVD